MNAEQIEITFQEVKRKRSKPITPPHPDPVLAKEGANATFVERFWKAVHKTDSCWIWVGAKDCNDYGYIRLGPKTELTMMRAHKASWLIHRGAIPQGLGVLHNCPGGDNPMCVNPDHLWLGTQTENMMDCHNKRRASPPPHPSGENHPEAKLTKAQVSEIRQDRATIKTPYRVLAKRYNVSSSLIFMVSNGQAWVNEEA